MQYRQTQEEMALRALRTAIQRRQELERAMERVRQRIQQLSQLALAPEEWLRREQAIGALQARLNTLKETLPLLIEQEQQAREAYLQARQRRESLSRLRARALDHFQQELSRILQRETDEVVVYAYQRSVPADPSARSGDTGAD